MKIKLLLSVASFLALPLIFFGQFRNIYLDADSNNEIKNINFISAKEGYVTFDKFIGYTQDSGHTFIKKYITLSNVDYNGYSVNLTFGFDLKGTYTFSKDSFLVYGDYGFVPSILFTADQGNTFKLIYNSTLQLSTANEGVQNMVFPQKSNTGYAVETNRILKTVNRGMSWSSMYDDAINSYFDIKFFTDLSGFAVSHSGVLKTTNGGNSWLAISVPPGYIQSMSFITESKGWLVIDNSIYYTNDGGTSWQIKNNRQFYTIGYPITFINDSTGFYTGDVFNTYKTTDSGKIWEPLPRNNNYSYYSYKHNSLFFLDAATVWAGGGHGFLELSTNSGGSTLPVSKFAADVSLLSIDSVVSLINYSKPGYQYKWLKNSVQLASSYNASYVSGRQTIDTIKLIVIKGSYADTTQLILDTRDNTVPCFATFQALVDTGSVNLTPGYQAIGVKHYWYFGDGAVDSINNAPSHIYNAIGNYTIAHTVYNTIDKCSDSTTSVITIIRTQNCLAGSFTYAIADSFYTNTLVLKLKFDTTKEIRVYPLVTWDFGDGTSGGGTTTYHAFDSSKYYNVCATVKNYYTGCVNSICEPVKVTLSDSCNADFLIETVKDNAGYFLPERTVALYGKPYSSINKRNTWSFNNTDTTDTGNTPRLTHDFFTYDTDFDFDVSGNSCGYGDIAQICIDSLNQKITHIIYDSVLHCTNTVSKSLMVPREYQPFIKAVPDPSSPFYVSFYAYTIKGTDTVPYGSRWRIQTVGGGERYYAGDYSYFSNKLTYTFTHPGDYNIAVAAQSCNDIREVYYINYHVSDAGPLPLTWGYFTGKRIDNYNNLTWATTSEENTAKFFVERSADGVSFTTVGSKDAAGNASNTTSYQYKDYEAVQLPFPVFYYRIKQTDIDGKNSYSKVILIDNKTSNAPLVKVSPNPNAGIFTVEIKSALPATVSDRIELYDAKGVLVYRQSIPGRLPIATYTIKSLQSLSKGAYYVSVILSDERAVVSIIKN